MVKIRLMRTGSKRNPHYRMVVVDARKKRSSDFLEQLGHYDPRETTDPALRIDTERASHWLSVGAQPSETVLRLLESHGVDIGPVQAKRADGYVKRVGAGA